MPRIVETIVTTTNAEGEAHIAPLGLIAEGERWVIAPFRPSRTLDNLREVPFAVASHTDDVRVFAGCLTGRKSWPTRAADKVKGVVLEGAVSHWELAVDARDRGRACARALPAASCTRRTTGRGRASTARRRPCSSARCWCRASKCCRPRRSRRSSSISRSPSPRPRARARQEAWGWLMERIDAWRAERAQKV